MTIHPAAEIFPMLGWGELQSLADDIKANGQRDPIIRYHGAILDGRNRLRACEKAGVDPRFIDRDDIADPVAFVVSVNLHRRHLNESQRAQVANRIADMPQGARTDLGPIGTKSKQEAAALLNVSERSVKRAAAVQRDGAPELVAEVDAGRMRVSTAADLAELPKDRQREIVAAADPKVVLDEAKKIRAKKQEKRRGERVEKIERIARGNAPLLEAPAHFPVLLADPPWRYEAGSTDPSRDIENQYPTMSLDDICALKVRELATPDAILFLWHPPGMATEAVRVATAWGFRERSSWVWVKDSIGPGYWGRLRHEMLMICTRGDFPAPAPSDRFDSVIEAPRGEHSAKPIEAAERIERMFPTLPRMELFARAPRPGWSAWGNQAAETLIGRVAHA